MNPLDLTDLAVDYRTDVITGLLHGIPAFPDDVLELRLHPDWFVTHPGNPVLVELAVSPTLDTAVVAEILTLNWWWSL